MGFLDIFSLLILLFIVALALDLLLLLGWLPGNSARQRHSPWAEPINVAGWIGILLPPIRVLALIAAYIRPSIAQSLYRHTEQSCDTQPANLTAADQQTLRDMERNARLAWE